MELRIPAEQREMLAKVHKAALVNPFSTQLPALAKRIAGARHRWTEDRLWDSLGEALAQHLGELRRRQSLDIRAYEEPDRSYLETAVLLETYLAFRRELDKFIAEQFNSESPVPILCADPVLHRLVEVGLERDASMRYLALFYQLRRAWLLIRREITGNCASIMSVRMQLWNAIFTARSEWYLKYLCGKMEDFSTLLLGETGTGKTAAARAIGLANFIPYDPKTKRFKEGFIRSLVAVNLAEYPSGLIESQLFGHKRGAFTGAIDNHQGVFGRCSIYGSVFIDEIGDVDLPTQIKLLTVLQERTFTPVGSQEKLRFHGRVIAATNKDLEELRTAGHFRDDFYYRLCSDVITLPPLRQRIAENPGELRLILDALIKKTIGEQSERFAERIEQRIHECLPSDYPWPGNVRELEQCVRRICLTGAYSGDRKPRPESSDFQKHIEQGNLTAVQLLSAYCQMLYKQHGNYEEVARITALDRRTVKKYIQAPAVV